MREIWRNLLRRRLRTSLTVMGIVVGTLALTVMGAMSEKINLLVDGALRYYNTRVIVEPRSGVPGQVLGPPLTVDVTEQIAALPGVDKAFPTVYMLYSEGEEEGPTNVSISFPPVVVGADARRFDYEGDKYPVVLAEGRFYGPGDRSKAVVGMDLAKLKKANLGGAIKVRGRDFEVVGIMERTLTVRDNLVFVPLPDAQELMAATLPPPLNNNPYILASEIEVYPTDLKDADAVAEAINANIKGVRAMPPKEIEKQFRQGLVIFNVIIIGSALIAVIVGGLSILNTMAMAVSERTREIGIKKAVGASNGDILKEFLQEAIVMGFVGGLFGLLGGTLMVWTINQITAAQGVVIFAITPRLSVFVTLFATVLGAAAGFFPALAAARRNPVEALRAE